MVNDQQYGLFDTDGEAAALLRVMDWHNSVIGDPGNWPTSLKNNIKILLGSNTPMYIAWGKENIQFYNDGFAALLGETGLSAIGKEASETLADIWDIVAPLFNDIWKNRAVGLNNFMQLPGVAGDHLFSYSPLKNELGAINGVFVTAISVPAGSIDMQLMESEQTRLKLRQEIPDDNITSLLEQTGDNRGLSLYNVFMHSPFAITILSGKDFIIDLANEKALELWGRTSEEVINKPTFESFPELLEQGFKTLLTHIYETGESFSSNGNAIDLLRNGQREHVYVNYVYEPVRDVQGNVSGIIGLSIEVTEQVTAHKKIEESEARFRNVVMQAPIGITIFRGRELHVEMANEAYLHLIEKTEVDFVGKPLMDAAPELRGQGIDTLLWGVMETGKPYYGYEFKVHLLRNGVRQPTYFDFVYHPLQDIDGSINGIMVVATEVTEQVEAKHSLMESERRFRDIVTNSPIAMAIFRGPDLVIELTNETLLRDIWKREEHEVMNKKLLEVFPELVGQPFPELLYNVLKTGNTHKEKEAEAKVETREGLVTYYLDYEYAPLFDADDSVSGIMVTVSDVTEKVEARRKIEDAEDRLRIAAESTGLAYWDLDLRGNYNFYHSPRLAEIFGHDRGIRLSHEMLRSQIYAEDMATQIIPAHKKALETGLYEYEARVTRNGDNAMRWIRTQGRVLYDQVGTPLRMLGTLIDITDQKLAHQTLEESEARFREVANIAPVKIWVAGTDKQCTFINRRWLRFTGRTLQNELGTGWFESVHPDDVEEWKKLYNKSFDARVDFTTEFRVRRYDGVYRWLTNTGIPRYNSAGDFQGYIGSCIDIHDQKMLASKLEKLVDERTRELSDANENLERSNQELEQYAFVTSHDLQEPLRKIQTFANLLYDKNSETLNEEGKVYLDKINAASLRMSKLIQDLLNFSRLNRLESEMIKTDLNEVINNIRNDFELLIKQKDAVITNAAMPVINAIPLQMNQLFFNLVSNALKFAAEGRQPVINITVKEHGSIDRPLPDSSKEYYEIIVADNGIGFNQVYAEKVFEIFQRLNDRAQYEGTGIGLALCHKIVSNHNGIIYVDSRENEGSQFHVILPA